MGYQRMRRVGREDRGAALVTVMLFTMLTFILITTMLAVTGNEGIIAGLHRDGVRATEITQAGLQEAIARLANARGVPPDLAYSFNGSLNSPNGTATITYTTPLATGPSGNYRQILVRGTAGRANREIRAVVLVSTTLFLPNHSLGEGIRQPGNPNPIRSGDVYSTTFVQYQELPSNKDTATYSGWRISRCRDPLCNSADPDRISFCYRHADCKTPDGKLVDPAWYPGTRVSTSVNSALGQDILQWGKDHCGPDGNPIGLGGVQILQGARMAEDDLVHNVPRYGFMKDDTDYMGASIPAQVDRAKFPCGLPYKVVDRTFRDETNPGTGNQTRYFKTVIFDQWLANYWEFGEAQLGLVKKANLKAHPEFGAIPPQPGDYLDAKNFDKILIPTDVNPGTIGCHAPEMSCSGGKSQMVAAWVDGNWTVNKPGGLQGHGLLVVNGDLTVDSLGSTFEYWGTIVVRGRLIVNSGQLNIHGGLIAKDLITVNGNFVIQDTTGSIGTPQVGPTTVTLKAWYER